MAQRVNFGLWYDFRNPARWRVPFEQLYRDTLDQIIRAEELGFDSIWLTEHHFCDDGYTPSPLVIAAAIAARTKQVRIGTNLMLLPLYDPIRVVEDSAAVSLISGGRFDLGVGAGYVEAEYKAFGRKLKHRPSLMEEAVEIVRRGWSGEAITFRGKRFNVDDLRILPAPENTPKLLMGGISEPAIDRIARIGDGFLSSGGVGHDLYFAGLEKAGKRAEDGPVYAGCWGIVSEDPEAEFARIGDHLAYQMDQYMKMGAFGGGDGAPRFDTPQQAVENGLYQFWTVDEAVHAITDLLTSTPQIVDLHFWAQFPGEPISSGGRRMELLAKKVLPLVRQALA